MRLWSLHPRYLDRQGLLALWREALLARAVLGGRTRGYRNHPQLERFRCVRAPCSAMDGYLKGVLDEAVARGYAFDRRKIGRMKADAHMFVTSGQVEHEWRHLMQKLAHRNPAWRERWRAVVAPECHPMFRLEAGPVESWERVEGALARVSGRGD